ncbi:MAG: NUDIX hydrolase, partial [Candidatus Woesearchaeota archaeon]
MAEEKHDSLKYEKPFVTVDIVIFTIQNEALKVLLIKRGEPPFKNCFALPGGFVEMKETLDVAAARELEEETGVKYVYLEQLYTFGEPNSDPRTRVITVSYIALIDSEKISLKASTDAISADWFDIDSLPKL